MFVYKQTGIIAYVNKNAFLCKKSSSIIILMFHISHPEKKPITTSYDKQLSRHHTNYFAVSQIMP